MPASSTSRKNKARGLMILIFAGLAIFLFLWLHHEPTTPGVPSVPENKTPERQFHRTAKTPKVIPAAAALDQTNSPVPISTAVEDSPIEIFGKVVLKGEPPRPKQRDFPNPISGCENFFEHGEYQVASDGGLANVFVYVKHGLEGKQFPTPTKSIELEETNCHFQPFIFGAQVEQSIILKNFQRHHPFKVVFSSGKQFGWARSANGRMEGELEAIFSSPDVLSRFTCTIHPWNWGYVGVLTHPFFAVTTSDGAFRLPKGIPPGNYVIETVHPQAGRTTRSVIAVKGGKYQLLFTIPAPKKPPRIPEVAATSESPDMEFSSGPNENNGAQIVRAKVSPGSFVGVRPGHASTGATIQGRIFLAGTPPAEKAIPVSADPLCGKLSAVPMTTHFYRVGKNGELADTFIYIKAGLPKEKFAPPQESVLLDQRGCEYQPYLFGLQTGQAILVRNSDPILHNVHPTPNVAGNKESNKAQMPKSADLAFAFDRPELFLRFKCDIHPWMFAYACAVDHPFFAVSGPDGNFAITNVPPGRYVVEAAHRKAGSETREIEIQDASQVITLNFELEAR